MRKILNLMVLMGLCVPTQGLAQDRLTQMALFRETKMAKDAVDKLKRAQIEAEIRCF